MLSRDERTVYLYGMPVLRTFTVGAQTWVETAAGYFKFYPVFGHGNIQIRAAMGRVHFEKRTRSDVQPLITAAIDDSDSDRFNKFQALMQKYFPPRINRMCVTGAINGGVRQEIEAYFNNLLGATVSATNPDVVLFGKRPTMRKLQNTHTVDADKFIEEYDALMGFDTVARFRKYMLK